MTNPDSELRPVIDAETAIRRVYDIIKQKYLGNFGNSEEFDKLFEGGNKPTAEEWLNYRSDGLCAQASAFVIDTLLSEGHPKLKKFALLRGRSSTVSQFKYREIGINIIDWHAYFLIQDDKDVWYAGSPANSDHETRGNDLLTRLIKSKNLDKVVKAIEERDGGLWENASDIERSIDHGYEPPIRHPDTNTIEIMTFDPSCSSAIIFQDRELSFNPYNFVMATFPTNFEGVFESPISN